MSGYTGNILLIVRASYFESLFGLREMMLDTRKSKGTQLSVNLTISKTKIIVFTKKYKKG